MKIQSRTTSLILIVTLLLCPVVASAQQSRPKTAEDTAQRAKAFELLESLATQLGNLQSAENRARLGANIADSLWTHDEKRARTLFHTVAEDIKLGLAKSYDDKPADFRTAAIFLKLRLDTTERIAKHDAEFALSFLNATEPPPVRNDQYRPSDAEAERALQVRLAKKLAENNPELAVKLARQSLERGFDRDLVMLLRRLHRTQRETGVALYRETVAKLAKVNLTVDWKTTNFVIYLVESMPPPLADETSYRQLINYLITTALTSHCKSREYHSATYFCNQIRQLSWQMAQVDRQRTSQLVELPTNVENVDLRQMQISHELDELIDAGGSIEEFLAVAEKNPASGDWIYQRVVQLALSDGDLDRARKITKDSIKDSRSRERLLAQINRLETESTASDEEVEAALREINETENLRSRIEFLRRFAIEGLIKEKALKVLDQATALTDEISPASDQTALRLSLAVAYCTHKSDRGLALVESEITKLNELIVAAAKLDGFDTRYLREGEWNMSAQGPLGELLTRLSDSASAFAWCDFDRAVTLASQFERAEIRMMAQIRLAQGILSGPPRRRRMVYFEFVEH